MSMHLYDINIKMLIICMFALGFISILYDYYIYT